jgi:hypothetical protein
VGLSVDGKHRLATTTKGRSWRRSSSWAWSTTADPIALAAGLRQTAPRGLRGLRHPAVFSGRPDGYRAHTRGGDSDRPSRRHRGRPARERAPTSSAPHVSNAQPTGGRGQPTRSSTTATGPFIGSEYIRLTPVGSEGSVAVVHVQDGRASNATSPQTWEGRAAWTSERRARPIAPRSAVVSRRADDRAGIVLVQEHVAVPGQ